MKKVNYAFTLVMLFVFIASVAMATGVRNEFSEYEITPVEDLHIGKRVDAIWILNYNHSEKPVTVVKRKTMEGIEYVVQSDFFAVSYFASAKGFGAKEARKSWTSVDGRINSAVINRAELKKQEIITPNNVDDERALGLIASYLPALINDGYTHVLN